MHGLVNGLYHALECDLRRRSALVPEARGRVRVLMRELKMHPWLRRVLGAADIRVLREKLGRVCLVLRTMKRGGAWRVGCLREDVRVVYSRLRCVRGHLSQFGVAGQ